MEILLFAGILVMAIINLSKFYGDQSVHDSAVITDTAFSDAYINDSLPHWQYKKLADSLKLIQDCNDMALQNRGTGISYVFPSYAEFESLGYCDQYVPTPHKYYLQLPGYSLRPDASTALNKGQFYTRSIVWQGKAPDYWHGRYVYTPTDVRFKPGQPTSDDEPTPGTILLPISKTSFSIVRITTWILGGALAIYFLWLLLVLPVKTLFRIARGEAFEYPIYKAFYQVGWSLVLVALLPMISALLFDLVFGSRIPHEFYISILRTFIWYRKLILVGLIILLLGRAFHKGYDIQRDHERTV